MRTKRWHRKVSLIGAGAVVALLALTACGSTSSNSAAMSSAVGAALPAPAQTAAAGSSAAAPAGAPGATDQGNGKTAAGGGQAGAPELLTAPTDRQVVRTATLTVDVLVPSTGKGDDADQNALDAAMARATAQARGAAGADGYVGAAEGKGSVVTITLRVPTTGYQQAMDTLAGLGKVTGRQESVVDVTAQLVDLGSRMETMKASVARIRTLLSKADKIGDVVAIESELAQREADLESLQRQQAALAGQAALSTIAVTLTGRITGIPAAAPPPAERGGFLGGLAKGWHALKTSASGLAAFVGAILPFLPLAAVVVLVAWWWRRRVRRQTGTAPTAGPPIGRSAEPTAAE